MNYKDKFKAQMKKAGINSLDDLKTDAEKKAFFKAVDNHMTLRMKLKHKRADLVRDLKKVAKNQL